MMRLSSNTCAYMGVAKSSSAADSTPMKFDDALEIVGMGRAQQTVLVIGALCFMSDAIEISLLSFCAVVLRDEWDLSPVQDSLIGFSTFFGGILGAPFYGTLADKIGRRPALLWMTTLIGVFGFLSALCQDLVSFLIVRVIVGTGIGGLAIVLDVLAEITPVAKRGVYAQWFQVAWALGALLLTVSAWLILDAFGWRIYVAASAVPALLACVVAFFALPESPRWLLEVGRHQESVEGMREFARKNGSEFNIESLASPHRVCDDCAVLLSSKYKFRLMISCIIWFSFQAAYGGMSMITPRLFETDSIGEGGSKSDFHFRALMLVASAELAGVPFLFFCIDRLPRILLQTLLYLPPAILCPLLGIEDLGYVWRIAVAFVIRSTLMNATAVSWIHTAEIFPTVIRARGTTFSCTFGRFGASLVQFVVSDTIPLYVTMCCIGYLCLVAASVVWLHPESQSRNFDEVSSSTDDESDELSDESFENSIRVSQGI
eukprot:TRINITY_DN4279_c0_g2_i1.p1 TRINITY_DN4279_c0_g2~~TRINITY_DN4279_c0_g2_i1.p1  ORF type:complete len:488 (+),score=51.55 TRINITY_DN4279_c0_g2_i1:177-1640(+)